MTIKEFFEKNKNWDTKDKKILMYSGGMDSWLIRQLWKPDVCVFVDVGTKSSKEERKRLSEDVVVIDLDISEFELPEKNYLLPLRNLFFVELGSYFGDIICLGATGTSTHFDKTEEFAQKTSEILNYLYKENNPDRAIKIIMPYCGKYKQDMLKEYLDQGGDIKYAWEHTFSCYNPQNGMMCGKCSSCKKRIEAFKLNGFDVVI